jgi:Tfp pilus assembly protein PilX
MKVLAKNNRMNRQRGVALVIGLIFLLMLTLISVIAMRGTSMEMMMSTAGARSLRAVELSERSRRELANGVLEGMLTDGGTWGGGAYTNGAQTPSDLTAVNAGTNYNAVPLGSELVTDPNTWADDLQVVDGSTTSRIAVVKVGTSRKAGAEASNTRLTLFAYYKIKSTVDAPDGTHAQTISTYRYGITN